jgi:hypothetical protein
MGVFSLLIAIYGISLLIFVYVCLLSPVDEDGKPGPVASRSRRLHRL